MVELYKGDCLEVMKDIKDNRIINFKQRTMNKTELINKITLLDTSIYRKIGFLNSGVYLHEPLMYRKKLYEVYEKLDIETLAKLLELKQVIK